MALHLATTIILHTPVNSNCRPRRPAPFIALCRGFGFPDGAEWALVGLAAKENEICADPVREILDPASQVLDALWEAKWRRTFWMRLSPK